MRISAANWMQVADYLERDDRAVVPLGSTEQHGYLSLAVDTLIPERLAAEAAEPLAVPVFPAMPFGVAPYFSAFPGTVSLEPETYEAVIRNLLRSLYDAGFRRIVLVNGHGGNIPALTRASREEPGRPAPEVRVFNWWRAPRTLEQITRVDPRFGHASWMENFPWTRLEGVSLPEARKPLIDPGLKEGLDPAAFKDALGDGSYGGEYEKPDREMMEIWRVAVDELRDVIQEGWRARP